MKKTIFKTVIIIVVILSGLYFLISGRSSKVTFQKTYGGSGEDRGSSVIELTGGGYMLLGTTRSFGAGEGDIYLVKIDENGNIIYERTYGGSKNESGRQIIKTEDDMYIIFGITESEGAGGADYYVIKIDSEGKEIWERTYGGPGRERGRAIIKTSDGGYALFGSSVDINNIKNMYLVKTDENGDKLWEKRIDDNNHIYANAIVQTPDDGYMLLGRTDSIGKGGYDMYLIRVDKRGEKLWSRTYGGEEGESAQSMKAADDGNYIIFGWTNSMGEGSSDYYILKVDENGEQIWHETIGSELFERGADMDLTSDGGYILIGCPPPSCCQ